MHFPAFRNEPLTDFSRPENRSAMEAALAKVRSQLGREYSLRIGGETAHTGQALRSLNPSHPSQVVGVHAAADAELARRSITAAHEYFPCWAGRPAAQRVQVLASTARILRERKHEFSAWMVYEVGKT